MEIKVKAVGQDGKALLIHVCLLKLRPLGSNLSMRLMRIYSGKKQVRLSQNLGRTCRCIYAHFTALNSEETWKILREQSKLKLMQLESKLPSDAKLLEKRRFNEMLQNLDGRIGHYRNNLAQMHRISETNQDKMSLIIVNNPLPDLTDMKGNCGPMQYLIKSDSKQTKDPLKNWHEMPPLNHSRKHPSLVWRNSYSLKKEQCHRPGKQAKRSQRNANSYTGCQEYSDENTPRLSVLPKLLDNRTSNSRSCVTNIHEGPLHELCPISREMKNSSCGTWEPLSLSALQETSPTVTAPGAGHFRYGQKSLWTVNSSISEPTQYLWSNLRHGHRGIKKLQ